MASGTILIENGCVKLAVKGNKLAGLARFSVNILTKAAIVDEQCRLIYRLHLKTVCREAIIHAVNWLPVSADKSSHLE